MLAKETNISTHGEIHTHHMALFGVPGHFSKVKWIARQLVMDEHMHTQSDTHPLTARGEPRRL